MCFIDRNALGLGCFSTYCVFLCLARLIIIVFTKGTYKLTRFMRSGSGVCTTIMNKMSRKDQPVTLSRAHLV